MKKLTAVIFTAGIIFIFFFSLISPDRAVSVIENRQLTQKPDFSISGMLDKSFTQAADDYIVDQFPFRDSCIKAHQWLSTLKNRNTGADCTIVEGQNGYNYAIYDDGEILSYYGLKKDKNCAYKWIDRLTELSCLSKDMDFDFFYAVVSSKVEALNSMLPPDKQHDKDEDVFKIVREHIPDNINVIDITENFKKIPVETLKTYYLYTDPHWNFIGANAGFNVLLSHLAKTTDLNTDFSKFELTPKGGKVSGFAGMYNQFLDMKYPQTEDLTIYLPKDESVFDEMTLQLMDKETKKPYYVNVRDVLAAKTEGEGITYQTITTWDYDYLHFENPNALNDYKLLVIKDSFFSALLPNITLLFKDIYVVDTRYWENFNVADFAAENKIDGLMLFYNSNAFFKLEDHLSYNVK